ncbi:hypothetical protein FZEAL_9304 [Fusarium zealandicum]|uniref:Uncharacterized protein n=1 Tax=Fusarium zealandicum TaxID=1053134 RepID=A0A8H4UBS7_9HYPO|nr:hypothetical protein FZEAL_9304 [Fusarium zealandicum]
MAKASSSMTVQAPSSTRSLAPTSNPTTRPSSSSGPRPRSPADAGGRAPDDSLKGFGAAHGPMTGSGTPDGGLNHELDGIFQSGAQLEAIRPAANIPRVP